MNEASAPKKTMEVLYANIKRFLIMVFIFVVASAIGVFFRSADFPDTNVVVVYLLAVLIIAWLTHSFVFGFAASVLATVAYNYIFAEPFHTFSIDDKSYLVTFVTMTLTALVTSTLTLHEQQSALIAKQKESETKAIYDITNYLSTAKDIFDIISIAASTIGECFDCEVVCLCFDDDGLPEHTYIHRKTNRASDSIGDTQKSAHRIGQPQINDESEYKDWPIAGRESALGLIRIPVGKAQMMNETHNRILGAMIESTALAMDRLRSTEQHIKLREETAAERYRANLLRAISHDLRSPLSAIIGSSDMIMSLTKTDDPRHTMINEIRNEADWLRSLVENILNLTRLQDGRLGLKKQPEAVEEIIGGAIRHVLQRLPDYTIRVEMPEELLLVPMEAKLIEQVLINLLDNAVKHSNPDCEILVIVESLQQALKITVRDNGKGILESDLPHVFQMFYTTSAKHADAEYGIGLGLAICETIVKAHGGEITADNRADNNGAEFVFTLPKGDTGNG